MAPNVHHMHYSVNRKCASGILAGDVRLRDKMCMTRSLRKTFLREWRKMKPGRTLETVAAELHISRTQLGRIEKGQQPYNQELLEAVSDLYGCTVADLLMRNPKDPTAIWSIWERAKPGQREQIVKVAAASQQTRTGQCRVIPDRTGIASGQSAARYLPIRS